MDQQFISLVLDSLSRIEELITCLVGLAAEGNTTRLRKNRIKDFSEQWLDKQEVMQMLKIGERTLFSLRKNKNLPVKMIGGKIYFHIKDVEKLMSQNK